MSCPQVEYAVNIPTILEHVVHAQEEMLIDQYNAQHHRGHTDQREAGEHEILRHAL